MVTIPDDYGDLYNYPDEVLHLIRAQAGKTMKYILDAPSRVQLFVYDNNKFIIRSDFENVTWVGLEVPEGKTRATDLVSGRSFTVESGKIRFRANPGVNYVLDII